MKFSLRSIFSLPSPQKILEKKLRNAKLDLIEYQDSVEYYSQVVKYMKVKIRKLETAHEAEKARNE